MTSNKEIRALTGIRGVAALYVALFHNLETHGDQSLFGWQVFINHGFLSVDLFFILSGFVMTISSKRYFEDGFQLSNYWTFMRKRFARLYPMYFVVLVVGFFFVNHLNGRINFLIGLTMLSIIWAPGYVMGHMWSLSTEWVAYIVYPLLLKVSIKFKSILWIAGVILAAIIVIFFAEEIGMFLIPSKGEFAKRILRCFPEYLLGIIACEIVNRWTISTNIKNVISIISFASIIGLLFFNGTDFYVIILFAVLIVGLSNDNTLLGAVFASKVVYFLGAISYSLYLIHPIFIHYFKAGFYNKYGASMASTLIFNLIYCTAIVLVSYVTFKLIELPMQKLLNKKRPSKAILK